MMTPFEWVVGDSSKDHTVTALTSVTTSPVTERYTTMRDPTHLRPVSQLPRRSHLLVVPLLHGHRADGAGGELVAGAEEVRDQRPEGRDHRDQDGDRDGVVDPALGQQFAEEMIGHGAIAPVRDRI